MLRIECAVLLSALALATGCRQIVSSVGSGPGPSNREWAEVRDKCGPTILLINDSQKSPELGSKVGQSLSTCNGLKVVATQPASEAWAMGAKTADAEIIKIANEVSARTAFVLWVNEWNYTAGLAAHGTVKYRLRILNVGNGKELACAQQTCRFYGRTREEFEETKYKFLLWSMKGTLGLSGENELPP